MTLTYLTAMSNLAAYAFKCLKLLQSHLKGKFAANDEINRTFIFLKTFDARGLSAPALGAYTCIRPLFSNIFFS